MKVYKSSVLRPFGSLVRGVVATAIAIGVAFAFTVLMMYSGFGRWNPALLGHALVLPQFLAVAGMVLLIGLPITLNSFGGCRGTYRMAPTELEVWSGLIHKKMVAVKYKDITNITLSQGPLMQLLGTYDLTIIAPGSYAVTTLHGVRDAEELRLQLLERRDRLQSLEAED